MSNWLAQLKNAKKSCMVQHNLKKVHYALADGREMVEEYNMDTNVVTRRAWKVQNKMGGEGDWNIELGDAEPNFNKDSEQILIKEDSSQPIVSKRATRINLEWRIRNLPYPLETYSITVDADSKCLVVKTKNKKYYKILAIPEFDRLELIPRQEDVDFTHKFNTLIITIKKPKELLQFESEVLEDVKKLKQKNYNDVDNCKPS